MDEVLARVGSKRVMAMSHEMAAPAAMKAAAAAHVEKANVERKGDVVLAPEPSSSPTLPARPATARVGGVRASTTGISSLRASRPGTARGGVASSMNAFSAPKEAPPDPEATKKEAAAIVAAANKDYKQRLADREKAKTATAEDLQAMINAKLNISK